MTEAPEALLSLPSGTKGAGRIRYGAAMSLYQSGALSPVELEAWRIASARDTQALHQGLAGNAPPNRRFPFPDQTRQDGPATLAHLMEEATTYLAPLRAPGVAELRRHIARRAPQPRPRSLPPPQITPTVTDHLPTALAALSTTHPALAAAISAAAPLLVWSSDDTYPADQIGPSFPGNHAAASLIGVTAPFTAPDTHFGLLLIAPDVLCRDHHHAAPELILPLTGPHGWRFGPNRPLIHKPAHHPVWNDPHRPHLIKVGAIPFLAFTFRTRNLRAQAEILPADDWQHFESLRLKAAS